MPGTLVTYTIDIDPFVGQSLTGLPLLTITKPYAPREKTLTITRKTDASTPQLFRLCVSAQSLQRVVITAQKTGDPLPTTETILTAVTLSSCTHNSDGTDTITLSFAEIALVDWSLAIR